MISVRTYWFPGEFYEANPESSARYIGTITLHVEADSPPLLCALNFSGASPTGHSQLEDPPCRGTLDGDTHYAIRRT
jgi:hypothetical protein